MEIHSCFLYCLLIAVNKRIFSIHKICPYTIQTIFKYSFNSYTNQLWIEKMGCHMVYCRLELTTCHHQLKRIQCLENLSEEKMVISKLSTVKDYSFYYAITLFHLNLQVPAIKDIFADFQETR